LLKSVEVKYSQFNAPTKKIEIKRNEANAIIKIFLASNIYMSSKESAASGGIYDYVRFVSTNYGTRPLTFKINSIGVKDLTNQKEVNLTIDTDINDENQTDTSVHNKLIVQLLKMEFAMYPHLMWEKYIESEKYLANILYNKIFLLLNKNGIKSSTSDNVKIVKVSRNSLGVRINERDNSDFYSIVFNTMIEWKKTHKTVANYYIYGDKIIIVDNNRSSNESYNSRLKKFKDF
jgi:hypothetical protein